jgi:hypothetical protein
MLLAQLELLTPPFPALPPPDAPLPPACHPLLLSPLRRARLRSGSGCGRVGLRGVHGPYLQGTSETSKYADVPRTGRTRGQKSTYQRADGEHGEHPLGRVVVPAGPEGDGAPRPCGSVLPREEVQHQPRLRQHDGVRVLVHLEDAC